MTRRALVLALILLAAAPAGAHAATLTNSGGTLRFTAGTGVNVVSFDETAPARVVVARDPGSGDNDPLTTVTGCTTTTPQVSFTCDGVTQVVAGTTGGDDRVDASHLETIAITLSGGDGNDTLSDGAGDDTVTGGEGDDLMLDEAGADSFSGGPGLDEVRLVGTPLRATLDDVADDGLPGEGDNLHADIEDVFANTLAGGTATVTGSDSGNVLQVASGGGTITGGPGSDRLIGGPEDDTIDARDGYADRVSCGAKTDAVKADQLDQVVSDCETVTRDTVVGGADDRPPAVTWTAPGAGSSISADNPTTLTATATDDHGIAKVEFYDDDRLVCEDTAAPYACAYSARGGDVGRDTLIARAVDTADQASSAVQTVTVRRFSARGLTLKLGPLRDARAPYRFHVTGNLSLPPAVSRTQGCQGSEVSIIVRAGSRIVATRRLTLSRVCGYQRRISFTRRPGTRLRFVSRFLGNDVVQPISAPSRTGRTT